jgi:glycosyltransferase involved in cell wall biosynthesis
VEGPSHYSAWSELLEVFSEVILLARVTKRNGPDKGQQRIDGPRISVHPLAEYAGPWQYLQRLPALKAQARSAINTCDAYLLRLPGLVSRLVWQEIKHEKRGFGVEVLGDPWDAMAPGSIPGMLRPLYRRVAAREMKQMCGSAASVLYWSRHALQHRYPAMRAAETFVSPRVVLEQGFASPEMMAARLRRIQDHVQELRIGYLGSFAQLYKGPDTLLQALAICRDRGLTFKVYFGGEGKYRSPMEILANELSLGEHTIFLGQLEGGRAVHEFLGTLDLFVMPCRAEAFGRAFVEAMARGCPCIGSNVGGIPELLDPQDLVPANDPTVLAQTILRVANDRERMQAMSLRNLERAKEFSPDLLRNVRQSFYKSLKRWSQPKHTMEQRSPIAQSL